MDPKGQPLDRAALDLAYRRYSALVLRRARRMLADDQAARDVCQDVFVQLLRAGSSWAKAVSPVGWLYRTTTNCCLNRIRGKRRWHEFLRALSPEPAVTPSMPVRLLLQGLPAHLQEIALYYAFDQMSQQEIALVLGLSQKTVSNRLRELRCWLDERTSETKVGQHGN
jgi:RNA polymerase sigma factor (sigma-70 family)